MNKAVLVEGKLTKATNGSSGYDMYATEDIIINPLESKAVSTGVFVNIESGYEGHVRGRSGLNFKNDVFVPTGTIDSDYRGEVKVKMYNFGNQKFVVRKGDRIAQLIISKFYEIDGAEVLDNNRDGGFGHTGK